MGHLCVARSRHLHDLDVVYRIIMKGCAQLGIDPRHVHMLVNGQCPYGGVDKVAELWALRHDVEIEFHPGEGGKGGFPRRNRDMAYASTHAILIFEEHHPCRGTHDMHTQWIGAHGPTATNITTFTVDEEGDLIEDDS